MTHSDRWNEEEMIILKEGFLAGLEKKEIAASLRKKGYHRSYGGISRKMDLMKLRRGSLKSPSHKEKYRSGDCKETAALTHDAMGSYGKINPFQLAEIELAEHFYTFKGCLY